jgi:hypothetical protein
MKQLTYILLFSLAFLLSLPSCRKKATTDEEMREMIVGEWSRNYTTWKNGAKYTKYINFSKNGYFYWYLKGPYEDTIMYEGQGLVWKIKSLNDSIFYSGDTIIYEINNSTIFFYDINFNPKLITLKNETQFYEVEISKITLNKLIYKTDKRIKYDKN